MKKVQKFVKAAIFIFLMQMVFPIMVYGAEGRLSIAVSSIDVPVGNDVTVTLQAEGPGGEPASSEMEFTYNTSVFSFVNCDDQNYSGGEGGVVRVSGSTVQITLKAIDAGSGNLKVTGNNGFLTDSQEALSTMVAAGVTIQAQSQNQSNNSNKSSDNSLSQLTLSEGTLSPEFLYSVTEYTALVPYEVTDVSVNAVTSNSKAQVEAIEGGKNLQVGENTISITVKAENGARAVYTVVVTRQEGTAAGQADTANMGTGTELPKEEPGTTISGEQAEEYEMRISNLQTQCSEWKEKYQKEKKFARRTIAILSFFIIVLVVVCINLILFFKRNRDSEDDSQEEILSSVEPVKAVKVVKTKATLPEPEEKQEKDIEFIDLDKQ